MLVVAGFMLYLVPMLLGERDWDVSMAPLGVYVAVPGQQILIGLVLVVSVQQLLAYASYVFPQSVNYLQRSKILQCTTPEEAHSFVYSI